MNACGDSRLRGLRSRKPIGFRQWVVHIKSSTKSSIFINPAGSSIYLYGHKIHKAARIKLYTFYVAVFGCCYRWSRGLGKGY